MFVNVNVWWWCKNYFLCVGLMTIINEQFEQSIWNWYGVVACSISMGLWECCKGRLWKRVSLSIGGPVGEPGWEFGYRGFWETVKETLSTVCHWEEYLEGGLLYWELSRKALEMEYVFLLKRLREGNVEGGFLHWRLRETSNGRLWERNISFIGLHKGGLRRLEGRAGPIYLLGRDLYLIYFSVMCNVEVCGLIFDHSTL